MSIIKRFRELTFKDFLSIFYLIPALFLSLFFYKRNKNLILICEDENGARDNGYWLFKYICQNSPNQRVAYVINKSSPDYKKVQDLGEVIQWGSLQHWIYYLSANINVSTQKGGKPNAAIFYFLEVVLKVLKNKRVFLQHGIIINDSKWLHYEQTQMRTFICGAEPEYRAVIESFGYPEDNVKYFGLARFDNLHNFSVDKKKILLIPSWREWLVRKVDAYYEFKEDQNFISSEYYNEWNDFLSNKDLILFLEENNLELYFYPHRNLQDFLYLFERKSNNIIFADWKKYDIQDLLKESAFMITDYSSVFMDFAYMKKPMVFYQFDHEKFRKGQYGEGYFNYSRDGFGEVIYEDVQKIISVIKNSYANNFVLDIEYEKRLNNFFILHDQYNCKRTYEYLKHLLLE